MPPNHKDIYVKAFSTLRMGLPIFEPSIDVQLGDIGFMDEIDGLFHKLYNVTEPPVDIHGCPPAVLLVKGEPRCECLRSKHSPAEGGGLIARIVLSSLSSESS